MVVVHFSNAIFTTGFPAKWVGCELFEPLNPSCAMILQPWMSNIWCTWCVFSMDFDDSRFHPYLSRDAPNYCKLTKAFQSFDFFNPNWTEMIQRIFCMWLTQNFQGSTAIICDKKRISRWWFQILLIFTPTWGKILESNLLKSLS